jgi:hypothetical protein
MVEEFKWSLELAAGCGYGCGTTLMITTQVVMASLALLPACGGVASSLFALFVCVGVRFGA